MNFRRSGPTFIAALTCLLSGLWAPSALASPEFFKAVRQDDFAGVERFLAEGVTSRIHNAALIHAVSRGMVEALVMAGADPNAWVRDFSKPLHTASQEGRTEVVRALIEAGADVNVKSRRYSFTPLHLATWRGSRATPETLQALIAGGADVNAVKVFWLVTPLHFVAKYGRDPAMIDVLLDAGADPVARMRKFADPHLDKGEGGFTPLDNARKYNPRILRSAAGRRLQEATRLALSAGMDEPGCDGVVVQPHDTKLSYLAERTLGRASRAGEIIELNGLEGRGYRAGQCLKLPG